MRPVTTQPSVCVILNRLVTDAGSKSLSYAQSAITQSAVEASASYRYFFLRNKNTRVDTADTDSSQTRRFGCLERVFCSANELSLSCRRGISDRDSAYQLGTNALQEKKW